MDRPVVGPYLKAFLLISEFDVCPVLSHASKQFAEGSNIGMWFVRLSWRAISGLYWVGVGFAANSACEELARHWIL